MTDIAPLPEGLFSCILADPPWRFITRSAKGKGRSPDGPLAHYATMSFDDILALPVADVADKDCVLLLWITDPLLPRANEVAEAWGFRYSTVGFTWAKTHKPDSKARTPFPIGQGYWTRSNPEQCLLFVRGRPKRLNADVPQLIASPRGAHSVKPAEQYGRIERLVAGPYLELFARNTRPGWTSWGNETAKNPEVTA